MPCVVYMELRCMQRCTRDTLILRIYYLIMGPTSIWEATMVELRWSQHISATISRACGCCWSTVQIRTCGTMTMGLYRMTHRGKDKLKLWNCYFSTKLMLMPEMTLPGRHCTGHLKGDLWKSYS